MTYTLIAHQELGSAQANITFSSIPATFTDLELVLSLRSAGGSLVNGLRVEFNNNTSSVYSVRNLQAIYNTGTNSNTNPYNVTNAMVVSFMPSPSQTANTFSSNRLYIPNYASTTQNKSVSVDGVSEHNDNFLSSEVVALNIVAGLFSSTAAISSIKITSQEGNNLAQYSSAALYGITSGSSGGVVVS
jgi:hypothetical protein